ncbi:hypothetical protein ACRWQM_10835 [Shewanella sp. HL-SH5]|uniref:hypothetical protein n=1 Tax=Shewanella sp. HL-SH5 TaxID=3436241 RepID=UPI003EBBEA06
MNNNGYFNCAKTNTLWQDYFAKVDKELTKAPFSQAMTIRQELESHAFEAAQANPAESQLQKLSDALKSLGQPQDIIPPLLSAAFVTDAQHSGTPAAMGRVLGYQSGRSVKKTLLAILIGFIALLALPLAVLALLKPFFYDNIGLFTKDDGMMLGFFVNVDGWQEHLGYGFIPLALISSWLLYKLAIAMLKLLK